MIVLPFRKAISAQKFNKIEKFEEHVINVNRNYDIFSQQNQLRFERGSKFELFKRRHTDYKLRNNFERETNAESISLVF